MRSGIQTREPENSECGIFNSCSTAERWFRTLPLASRLCNACPSKKLSDLAVLTPDQVREITRIFFTDFECFLQEEITKLKTVLSNSIFQPESDKALQPEFDNALASDTFIDGNAFGTVNKATNVEAVVGENFQTGLPALLQKMDEAESATLLTRTFASLDEQDKENWTLLMVATHRNCTVITKTLLDNKVNTEIENNDGWRALMLAAHMGHKESIRLLIDHKVDLNAQNKIGMTALMLAASRGHTEVLRMLLEAGASVHIKDKAGEPGIHPKPRVFESAHPYKHNMRDYTSVQIYGADSYEITFDERSSTEEGKDFIIFWEGWSFLDLRALKNTDRYSGGMDGTQKYFPGVEGTPPLEIKANKFMFQFCTDWANTDWGYKLTVTPKFRLDEPMAGWTALIWAAVQGRTDSLNILIENGVGVDIQGWDGKSALAWAVERHHEATAVTLIKRGASVHIKDKEGVTALEKAVQNRLEKVLTAVFENFQPFQGDGSEIDDGAAFVWTYLLSSTTTHKNDVCKVLDRYVGQVDRIKALANVTDSNGRIAIGLANIEYKSAIMERLYFYKRYEFNDGPSAHKSATCVVILATDHVNNKQKVALKFMAIREQYLQELETRQSTFDDKFVIDIITRYDGDSDDAFREETERLGYYKYCIVMQAAERSLQDAMTHEHISGRDWHIIAKMCKELSEALDHVHSKGIVHGDIKPMNIVRNEGRLKLIDFDGSSNFNEGNFTGSKFSSAYLPPEMVTLVAQSEEDCDDTVSPKMKVVVRKCFPDDSAKAESLPYERLPAHPSQDMWALGTTLFELCTGETLFKADDESNICDGQLALLYEWDDNTKHDKMAKMKHPGARNLVSRLLSKDPSKRPEAAQLLHHPFVRGHQAHRMVGEETELMFDAFVSYRVATDQEHAHGMFDKLTGLGCKVFLDSQCLHDGQQWQREFCEAVMSCRVFIPLISKDGHSPFTKLQKTSPCDNVLLELRLALELKEMGMVDAIFPVFVGDITDEQSRLDYKDRTYTKFSSWSIVSGCPDCEVDSVEKKLAVYLDEFGLGVAMSEHRTVKQVYSTILGYQGAFIQGLGDGAFSEVASKTKGIVKHSKNSSESSHHSKELKSTEQVEAVDIAGSAHLEEKEMELKSVKKLLFALSSMLRT